MTTDAAPQTPAGNPGPGPLANGQSTTEGLDDRDLDPGAGEAAERASKPASDLQSQRHELYLKVKKELAGPTLHDPEIQYELARWVELLEVSKHDLELTRKELRQAGPNHQERAKEAVVERVVRKAGAAIAALISDKPELVFARTLRIRAEMHLLRRNGRPTRHLVSVTDGSPTFIVGLGALGAFMLGMAGNLMWPWLQAKGLGASLIPLDAVDAPTLAAAAYLGGLISILSRLQGFSQLRDFDPMFVFLNALFKPFVGAVLGLFAYAAIKGHVVPLGVDLADPYTLWAIGFLAGFSERFANDIVGRGEGLAAPKKS